MRSRRRPRFCRPPIGCGCPLAGNPRHRHSAKGHCFWPAAALLGLPAHELDALVVHELAHVRRQDALINLLQACIHVLFFHHPAAWWISDQVRAEREHCADDLAVRVLEAGHAGSRLSYAKALLAFEERRQAHALALAANGGSLLDRIRRLAGVEEQPGSPVRPLATALMASLLVAVRPRRWRSTRANR